MHALVRFLVVVSLATLASTSHTSAPSVAQPQPGWLLALAHEREVAATRVEHLPRIDALRAGEVHLGQNDARIDAHGLRAAARGGASVSLALASIGRAGAMAPCAAAAPAIAGPEVRLARRAGVTEWWRSLPSGLEHGVDVTRSPPGRGALVLALSLGAGVRATPTEEPGSLAIRHASTGDELARYARLAVLDARGARIPARMFARGDRIDVEVDDRGAVYPLVVDPILVVVLEQALPSPGLSADAAFGSALALSAAGDRALVGSPNEDAGATLDVGGARIYVRTGTTWAQEAVLAPSVTAAMARFGDRVSLSADGTRAAVGGAGRVATFTRSGSMWAEDGAVPVSPRPVDLALSSDGSRLLLGFGRSANPPAVHAWSGGTWTAETVELATPLEGSAGRDVAFSSDGARFIFSTEGGSATARIHVRGASAWTEEALLSPSSTVPGEMFGRAVDIAADRALVAATSTTVEYVRTGTVWAPGATLTGGGGGGQGVHISADGTVALTGGNVAVRTAGTWATTGTVPGVGGLADDGRRAIASVSPIVNVYRIDPAAPTGTTCVIDADCVSGACARGVCCASACTSGCESCLGAQTGGADGACLPVLVGTDPRSACATSTATCRGDVCDGAGSCVALANGTECRPASGPCDVAESCAAGACPANTLAAVGTQCRAATDACDTPSFCDASGVCAGAGFLSGVVCRASSGACDVAESCFGTSPSCPPDAIISAGISCRAASDPACDVEEVCDGVMTACPADVTTCAPDAALADGGALADAAVVDGGGTPAPVAGCACTVSAPAREDFGVPASVLGLFALLLARRVRGTSSRASERSALRTP